LKLWKAAAQMRGEVKAIACNAIRTYYHLNESSTENIKDLVGWLVTNSVFAYGEVDVKVILSNLVLSLIHDV
jgi:hypothetical protein